MMFLSIKISQENILFLHHIEKEEQLSILKVFLQQFCDANKYEL